VMPLPVRLSLTDAKALDAALDALFR